MSAVLLPLGFLIITALAFYRRFSCGVRESVLKAAVVTGVAVVFSTELFSMFQSLTWVSLAAFWMVLIAIVAVVMNNSPKRTFLAVIPLSLPERCLCAGIGLMIIAVGINDMMGAANGWDSLVYHMSRVAHWAQNRTVANYPSNLPIQIYSTPFNEFALLHVYILGKSDRWVNCVAWLAFIGCGLGSTLICKELGGSRRGQILTALSVYTLPIALGQACSTKNDLMMTLWVVCAVYFLLRLREEFSWTSVIFAGLSLGLALLTKATAYLYCFSFLIFGIALYVKQSRGRKVISAFGAILLLALCLNVPYFFRLASDWKDYLSYEHYKVTNQSMNVPLFLSNAVKNIAINLSFPSSEVNDVLKAVVRKTHDFLNISVVDSRISYVASPFKIPFYNIQNDLNSSNLLHMVFVCLFVVLFLFCYRQFSYHVRMYFCAVFFSWVLFICVIKWQSVNSRFHLPLFTLFCPLLGLWFDSFKKTYMIVAAALFAFAIPKVLYNSDNPLAGPTNVFNSGRKDLYGIRGSDSLPYEQSSDYVKSLKCSEIGLFFAPKPHSKLVWEYLFWVYLSDQEGLRIEHVNVYNQSKKFHYPLGEFKPCAIIDASGKGHPMKYNKQTFRMAAEFDKLRVFIPPAVLTQNRT